LSDSLRKITCILLPETLFFLLISMELKEDIPAGFLGCRLLFINC
jgi:hypothetical protein